MRPKLTGVEVPIILRGMYFLFGAQIGRLADTSPAMISYYRYATRNRLHGVPFGKTKVFLLSELERVFHADIASLIEQGRLNLKQAEILYYDGPDFNTCFIYYRQWDIQDSTVAASNQGLQSV